MSAMVEYPVKTMNIHPERKRFQVDTGPLLFPDLSLTVERQIQCFSIAFVCYNTFDLRNLSCAFPFRWMMPPVLVQCPTTPTSTSTAKNTILAVE